MYSAAALKPLLPSHGVSADESAAALALIAAALPAAQAVAAPKAASGLALPISGAGSGATFNGILTLQRFVAKGSGVDVVGTLTGTVTDALGRVTTVAECSEPDPLDSLRPSAEAPAHGACVGARRYGCLRSA